MAPFRTKFNALVFSFFNSLLIFILVMIVSFVFSKRMYALLIEEIIFVIVLFLLSTIASYLLISIAFRKQLKQNFSQIIEHLPGEVIAKDYTLSNITESINRYKENKELEILLLKDRENYRKEFFGNVAHELKTPLFSMQGFLLTLIEGGMNDESIRYRYLDRINSSLERLIFIIKDLDLLSELENRNLKLNIKNFNLTALTREIIDILEYKAKKNKIKVDFTSGSNKDVFAIGDVERIGQVLTNLIANGISYAGEDATISVSFQNNANKIMVSIKDNGIGIKPEHLERLFERFYRVDEHRSRSQGGSGLGLSIVKNILHAHKENITVRSTYGYGTEFIFSLQKA